MSRTDKSPRDCVALPSRSIKPCDTASLLWVRRLRDDLVVLQEKTWYDRPEGLPDLLQDGRAVPKWR